jgi:hypothetical protein
MSEKYRVQVYLVGFDPERAPELKSLLKIYHNSQGSIYFKSVLRRAHEGERVMIYESNADIDAIRFAQSMLRGGAEIEIDGLEEDEEEF